MSDAPEDTPLMRRWDRIRAYIAGGGTGSYPRDWFESEIEAAEDRGRKRGLEDAAKIVATYPGAEGEDEWRMLDFIAAAIRAKMENDG